MYKKNNPFDNDDFVGSPSATTAKGPFLVTGQEDGRLNPFDALMPISSTSVSSSNTQLNAKPLNSSKLRSDSKDSSSSDSSDDEDNTNHYLPDQLHGLDDATGRNRALVFMETNVPPSAGTIECKLLVLGEDRYEFVHVATGRCWMRAQKRTEGLKRLNPATNFSLWVSPVLLVANNKKKGEEDGDSNISFFDVMRELEAAEILQGEVKRDNMLRVGKLRGSARGTSFQLWGTGKSMHKAIGVMDARPELFAVKFSSNSSTSVILPGKNQPKSRPTKKRDTLMNRSARNDPGLRRLTGARGTNNVWLFHCEGETDLVPTVRLTKGAAVEEFSCEFRDISPACAFALAIVIAQKNSTLLSTGQSWSSLLPRLNSMRRASSLGQHQQQQDGM